MIEVAIALQKAEPAGLLHPEVAHVQRAAVVERTPQPLAAREAEQEPVGIVHLGAKVVEGPIGVLAVEEHAGERRDPELAHLPPQEETAVDVDRRLLARAEHEAIGAGEARAVEEGVERQAGGPGSGAHQPELLEVRELLTPGLRRVDTEPARRQPEPLLLPDRPEIARAEED